MDLASLTRALKKSFLRSRNINVKWVRSGVSKRHLGIGNPDAVSNY